MLQHSKYRQSMTVTCPAKLDLLHVAFYGVFPSLHTVGNPTLSPSLFSPSVFLAPSPRAAPEQQLEHNFILVPRCTCNICELNPDCPLAWNGLYCRSRQEGERGEASPSPLCSFALWELRSASKLNSNRKTQSSSSRCQPSSTVLFSTVICLPCSHILHIL